VIHEVDDSLRKLVLRDAVNGSGVDVSFEAPTREWAAKRNAPTISIYLYDVREDLARREVQYEEVRDGTGKVLSRRPPPRRFKLSYLVTVWTQRPEDEHRVLSSLLACLLTYDALPDELLTGTLAEGSHRVLLTVGLPPPQDRSLADVWSALGGELKPSLDLVINTPFDTARVAAAGPPVVEPPRVSVFSTEDGVGDTRGE
jgi:Pvc16 N-terminal domain